jgi:DNA repair exonuclease SbcCD ATPase subunit
MEQTNPTAETEQKEKKGGVLIIVLFILVALLAGLSGYLFFELNELKSESANWRNEKIKNQQNLDEFASQLQELTTRYDSLMRAHEGMKEELEAERNKVVVLMADYQALKREGGDPLAGSNGSSLRARLEDLQQRYDEAESIIAKLRAENQELSNENFRNAKKLEETSAQNDKLTQENSKLNKTVEIAKRLKTYDIYADAVRVSGTKEKATTKASKADRIRVCFTILDNQLADKQEKYLYVVIKDPDGKTFTEGDSKITLMNGNEIAFSVKKDIFYDNKVMQLCMPYQVKQTEKLTAGEYKVEVYSDGVLIGFSEFTLK